MVSFFEFAIHDIEREAVVKEVLEIYASAETNVYIHDSSEDGSIEDESSYARKAAEDRMDAGSATEGRTEERSGGIR